jgi:hypothetical protein
VEVVAVRILQLRVLILAGATAVFAAQAQRTLSAPLQTATKKPAGRDVTLVGCVGGDTTDAGQFTLSDKKEGPPYRLSGTDMSEYSGRQVQIVGAVGSKRVHVVGGLMPSPNAAAQAGALDPARAQREASGASGAGAGTAQLPEFRVKRVRALTGSCP